MKKPAHYHWHEFEVGKSFFVPCLDLAKVNEQYMKAALKQGCFLSAQYAIYDGYLGVCFTRTR
jgi:hypothetical protein